MSIDVYFSAERQTPLTDAERVLVESVLLGEAHRTRKAAWTDAYREGASGDFTFSAPGPSRMNPKVCYLFRGSVQMPLVNAWSTVVLPLLEHWAAAFTVVRRAVVADAWDANMDDFEFLWFAATARYVLPKSLSEEAYRKSAEFSLGRALP